MARATKIKGLKGDTGDTGATGPTGPRGKSATAGRPASPGKSASAPGQRKKVLGLQSARTLTKGYAKKKR